MPRKLEADRFIGLTPSLVRLVIKTIKYSKGGLDKEERQELGRDLLELAAEVLSEVVCPPTIARKGAYKAPCCLKKHY